MCKWGFFLIVEGGRWGISEVKGRDEYGVRIILEIKKV